MKSTDESLAPKRLRCENLANPLGVDVAKPRLSWMVESTQRGWKQSAYRIVVASSETHLSADHGDLWDSGKVTCDETVQIPYAGTELRSQAACHWKVRVWDNHDRPSAWSAPAMWTLGLLYASDWQANWLAFSAEPDAMTCEPLESGRFRRLGLAGGSRAR